jgi:hypothetical protein
LFFFQGFSFLIFRFRVSTSKMRTHVAHLYYNRGCCNYTYNCADVSGCVFSMPAAIASCRISWVTYAQEWNDLAAGCRACFSYT